MYFSYLCLPLKYGDILMEQKEARTMDEWISVKERLPEDDLPENTKRLSIKVLVASSNGGRNGVRTISRQRWVTNCYPLEYHKWEWSREAECITHWMPLPEPPKKDDR